MIQILFYLILLFHNQIIPKSISTFQYNNADNKNTIIITGDTILEDETLFFSPIHFSTNGLKCFFEHRYNHPKYIEDYLPNNLKDIIKFIEHAKTSNQNKAFIKVVLKIFKKRIKSTAYISAAEILSFTNQLPDLLNIFMVPDSNTHNEEYVVKDILATEFADNFDQFKDDPNQFLNKLSQKICSTLKSTEKSLSEDITTNELKEVLLNFLENVLNKILWDANNPEYNIWDQFKDSCKSVYNLKNILHDMEDINDLINSLISRFHYITDMIGSEIELDVYNKAISDIQNEYFDWLEIEEYDILIKPKKEELLYILRNIGIPKALARQQFGYTEL